jgi:valyl-tRNA synthetase
MDKQYEPKNCETKIYELWEKSGFFNPDRLPDKRRKKYSISIPPPNITGSLHMGHALNNTIQDILTRYYRLQGKKTLWLPGIDHAGIATQNVVEKEISKEGLTRHQLGRDKFIERVWQWKEKYGNLILEQLKKLGCSCDWSRSRFTLDKEYERAVQTAFINYHKKGYIYRGPRIVNWCPRCATAISDIEVKYQEKKGALWYIKYPLLENSKFQFSNSKQYLNSKSKIQKFITVATTRPETMLGDAAVAVNPKDERYKKLVGQKVILPIMNREIPIIAHRLVDLNFGTGALKITPAHDKTDWQIGKENNLEIINVIGPDGKMSKEAGKYEGLSTLEARKKIIAELEILGLLEKTEEYEHQISLCDRCHTPVEPQISTQWFVQMEKLAQPAIKAVKNNKIKIIPERYKKVYLDWLNNIEDWCISRQLWWGHRLPIWLCQTANKIKNPCLSGRQEKLKIKNINNDYVVSATRPKKCPFCGQCEMKQSEDVLDTWFSSALWPFATLGWPEKTGDLRQYYPTSLLSTARDIIYLWVARMVFSGLEFLKKIPFREVYIHPTILNLEGKRMSKSLGTGIDPLGLIDKYGADATRFGLVLQTNRDQQAIRFDERTILAARNFVNKLWNISRFVKISTKQIQDSKSEIQNKSKILNSKIKTLTLSDKWILSRLNSVIDSITKKIADYQFGEAGQELYEFVWHEFADWYLEISKFQMAEKKLKNNTIYCLKFIIYNLLKLLHPFIPFVTEEINIHLNNLTIEKNGFLPERAMEQFNQLLIVANWSAVKRKYINKKIESQFEKIKKIVTEIRNWKSEQKIPFNQEVEYQIQKEEKNLLIIKEVKTLVEQMTKTKLIS